ncbi:MAG: type II secretion system F family protein [Nanoarchaeota archaeon]|nr:type II secretion system F family protein [Nanoarchaeota archaeon]
MRTESFSLDSIGKAFVPKKVRHRVAGFLLKAGVEDVPYKTYGLTFYVIIGLTMLIYFNPLFPIHGFFGKYALFAVFVYTFGFWVGVPLLFAGLFMIIYKVFYDLKTFQRRLDIELVLPDFLQLTAANIRAGMPIDRAMWYAVRPRFGVLAKEIELVAKQTLSGTELDKALLEFSLKYDSPTVERSINLLLSGLEAGGEIGDLLNKIATNIQEISTMKKEMAANVTTYVIFISFATIAAAPFMFALSYNLLIVIKGIMTKIELPKESVTSGGFGNLLGNLSAEGISISGFFWFCIIMLCVTSFFSSIIIATIKKGSVKEGFRYIPMFIGSTIALFLVASKILGIFLSTIV